MYLRLFYRLAFFTFIRILSPYLELEGQYRREVTSAVVMTVIDIAADAFVIFVLKGGMFELTLATSLGYIVSFLIVSPFFFNKKSSSNKIKKVPQAYIFQ